MSQAGSKAQELAGQAKDQISNFGQGGQGGQSISQQAGEYAGQAKDQAGNFGKQAQEQAGNLGKQAQDQVNNLSNQFGGKYIPSIPSSTYRLCVEISCCRYVLGTWNWYM